MNRIILVLLLTTLVNGVSFSQNRIKDSLWSVWNDKRVTDTLRIDALQNIIWNEYINSKPDSAFILAQHQYDLASEVKHDRHRGNARIAQAVSFYNRGIYDSAIIYNNLSFSIYEKIALEDGMANSLNNLGLNYSAIGENQKAIELYNESITIMRKLDNQLGIARSLHNIGIIQRSVGEYDLAIKSFEESLRIKQKYGGPLTTTSSLGMIGLTLKSKGQYDEALVYFHKAAKIERDYEDFRGVAMSYHNIGNIYNEKGDLASALKYYQMSFNINQDVGEEDGITVSLNNLGSIYLKKGQLKKAEKLLEEGLSIAQKNTSFASIRNIAENLYKVKRRLGKFEEALEYYILFDQTKEEIDSKDTHKEVVKSFYKLNYEKKALADSIQNVYSSRIYQQRIENNQAKLKRQKLKSRIFLGSGIVLLIWLIIQVYQLRLIRKQKRLIERQKAERERMIQEIHHRVKNNMQIVKSMLGLQMYRVEDEELVAILEECQGRIITMARVHETLYGIDQYVSVNAVSYFKKLFKDILSSYQIHREITLKMNIDRDLRLGTKTLVPLALAVNEIAANSCKYAYDSIDAPLFLFELKSTGSGTFQLKLGDNGIGEASEKLEGSNSLGGELIEVFVEQLNGTITKYDDDGMKFIIIFEDQDKLHKK